VCCRSWPSCLVDDVVGLCFVRLLVRPPEEDRSRVESYPAFVARKGSCLASFKNRGLSPSPKPRKMTEFPLSCFARRRCRWWPATALFASESWRAGFHSRPLLRREWCEESLGMSGVSRITSNPCPSGGTPVLAVAPCLGRGLSRPLCPKKAAGFRPWHAVRQNQRLIEESVKVRQEATNCRWISTRFTCW
jgi:hypothetical protein